VDAVKAKPLPGIFGVDLNIGWVEVVGKGIERREHVGGRSWGMPEGIAKLFECCCGQVRCFASNSSQSDSFRRVSDVCSEWCETVTDVASMVSHPEPIACGNLQWGGYEVQARVEEAIFQNTMEFLLHANKFGNRNQGK
jgi:hypothetical protein